MKREMSPWARIKREAPCVQQSYREKKKIEKVVDCIGGSVGCRPVIVRP